ncbi:MAG: hypothetical protein RSB39_01675 [Oscillospiraceae bacterium]
MNKPLQQFWDIWLAELLAIRTGTAVGGFGGAMDAELEERAFKKYDD